jgi:hypothetical protein
MWLLQGHNPLDDILLAFDCAYNYAIYYKALGRLILLGIGKDDGRC